MKTKHVSKFIWVLVLAAALIGLDNIKGLGTWKQYFLLWGSLFVFL